MKQRLDGHIRFRVFAICPYRKFRAAYGGCHSSKRTAKLKQFVALLESGERNSPMHACAREHSSDTDFKWPRRDTRSVVDSGSFRQPVVRSGGAVRRPAVRGGTDRSTMGGPLRSQFRAFSRGPLKHVRFGGAEPGSRARGQHANGRLRTELRGVS
jgi:hypothetical protein